MTIKSLRTIVAAVLAGGAVAMSPVASAEEPLKVGFVYVSPIGEAGWTWQQDIGRKQMEEALGDRVVTQHKYGRQIRKHR